LKSALEWEKGVLLITGSYPRSGLIVDNKKAEPVDPASDKPL
jgi:hypothetical protein